MSGLLASGDYTTTTDCDNDDDEPRLLSWDAGKEWQEDGHERRFPRHVVADAMSLLHDLESRLRGEDSEAKANAECTNPEGCQ